MDSASKAIIIAGGFFIGVLIVSISMYMLTTFREAYNESIEQFDAQQIMSFNSFFVNYPSKIKGYDAYNIIGKINEVNADPDSAYFIYFNNDSSVRTIDPKEYFYYTEKLANDYNYSYHIDADGYIDRIYIKSGDEII